MNHTGEAIRVRQVLVELSRESPPDAALLEGMTFALRAEAILQEHLGADACLCVNVSGRARSSAATAAQSLDTR